jgi:hypothetical protein
MISLVMIAAFAGLGLSITQSDRNGQGIKETHKVQQAQLQQGRVQIEPGHNIKQQGLEIKAIGDRIKPCTIPGEACSNHKATQTGIAVVVIVIIVAVALPAGHR